VLALFAVCALGMPSLIHGDCVDAVCAWLQDVGLGLHVDTFRDEEIDAEALFAIDDNDLRELGLVMGERKLFGLRRAELQPPRQTTSNGHGKADCLKRALEADPE